MVIRLEVEELKLLDMHLAKEKTIQEVLEVEAAGMVELLVKYRAAAVVVLDMSKV